MFKNDSEEALTIIDLDTMGMYSYLLEIGYMAWTWTKVGDGITGSFDAERWKAMFTGYRENVHSLSMSNWKLFPDACLLAVYEQAARYVTDAYEERYYTHDPSRYPSLYEQNLIRFKELYSYMKDFVAKRKVIEHLHSS
jgi:Ser/Thr protein kinase RdoA (MazF antagonist)